MEATAGAAGESDAASGVIQKPATHVQFGATGASETHGKVVGGTGVVEQTAVDGEDTGGGTCTGENQPSGGIDGATGNEAHADTTEGGGGPGATEHEALLGEGSVGNRKGTVTPFTTAEGDGVGGGVNGGKGKSAAGDVDSPGGAVGGAGGDGAARHRATQGNVENGVGGGVPDHDVSGSGGTAGGDEGAGRHRGGAGVGIGTREQQGIGSKFVETKRTLGGVPEDGCIGAVPGGGVKTENGTGREIGGS